MITESAAPIMKELEAAMHQGNQIPLTYHEYPAEEMRERACAFYAEMRRRRSVRQFSPRPVSPEVIADCLRAAGTAPSGANMQPWHFVVITDPAVKRQIREAAEAEEQEFYRRRASQEWLDALAPLQTNAQKPFLEAAPCLIAIFAQPHRVTPTGETIKHYYVNQSVGIATGILLAAVHHAGLVALTYTPSRMAFLNQLLHRPSYERPFLLLVVGYPAADATVPAIGKKPLEEIATFI